MADTKSNMIVETISEMLLKPSIRNACFTVFVIGVVFGAGVKHGLDRPPASPPIGESLVSNYSIHYEQAVIGMSLQEVRSILGPGQEIFRSESTSVVEIEWTNSDGNGFVGVFVDGALDTKRRV